MGKISSSVYFKLVIAFILFLIMAFFIKGYGKSDFIQVLLGAASFIFGIILAFSTANRHSRLSAIRESLREQDAILLNLFELSKVFDKNITDEMRKLIDELLVVQCDYFLIDFDKCVKEIERLYVFIECLATANKSQEDAKSRMLADSEDLIKIEKKVSYHTNDEMMMYEWISLIVLEGIIIFCLFFLKNESYISTMLTAVLSALLVMLLLILRDLDLLAWQEQNWIWEPLSNLFVELGLDPYFPGDSFVKNRINIKSFKEFKKVRVAKYPHPYPDFSGKTVKILKIK